MAAAVLSETGLLAGLPVWGSRPSDATPKVGVLADELCPVCEHPIHASHREVYPWDEPPMLLCFLMVEGRRCFTECGACRRNLA